MKKINIGDTFKLVRAFTKEDVLLFANLSGDLNPLHTNEEFAKNTIFKRPICHGLLVSSLFSNLLGNNLVGSIYLKQSLNFLRPVYIDEQVEACLTIKNLNPEKNQISLQTRIIKLEKYEMAVDGEALVKFTELKSLL